MFSFFCLSELSGSDFVDVTRGVNGSGYICIVVTYLFDYDKTVHVDMEMFIFKYVYF